MGDEERRTLGRAGAAGDVEARARELVARMRGSECPNGCVRAEALPPGDLMRCRHCLLFGSPERSRVALAATCGDPAALLAFDCEHDDLFDGSRRCVCSLGRLGQYTYCLGGDPIASDLVRGLERWGTVVQTRAVIALCEALLPDYAEYLATWGSSTGTVIRADAIPRMVSDARWIVSAAREWTERPEDLLLLAWGNAVLTALPPTGLGVPRPRVALATAPSHWVYALIEQNVDTNTKRLGERRAVEVINAALAPWALATTGEWPIGFAPDRLGVEMDWIPLHGGPARAIGGSRGAGGR